MDIEFDKPEFDIADTAPGDGMITHAQPVPHTGMHTVHDALLFSSETSNIATNDHLASLEHGDSIADDLVKELKGEGS